MKTTNNIFPIYLSLRYLPLLRSEGDEYISHFCKILSEAIRKEISDRKISYDFGEVTDQASLQHALTKLAKTLNCRIVLLFDDAAHIGREKPLEVFFDLFRTLSTAVTSCKASIYPGVTKFGIRFDVFNDSTVIDISRNDSPLTAKFFSDVVKTRFPHLADRSIFSDRLLPTDFANLLGRAVVGNIRGLILACNRFDGLSRIGVPAVNKCLVDMATDYYWPLMEEVAPKLGVYEPLIEPAREIMEIIVDIIIRSRNTHSATPLNPDRVMIHREIVSKYMKIFEILEYLGFIARREASRALKSGGRGPVFAVNLCNLLDAIPTKRLTRGMIDEWTYGSTEPAEIHVNGQIFQQIAVPQLPEEIGIAILEKDVNLLARSRAYPYGLTSNLIWRLRAAGFTNVGALADASDAALDSVELIGPARIKKIRDVVHQAIWM